MRLQGLLSDPPPLILVADDFADAREMVAEFLQFVGFRVQQARDGHEALEMATRLLPDAVLLDLVLPGLDGFQVIARLKASPRTQHIPIVVQSGHLLNDVRARVSAAGASLFLPKPCAIDAVALQLASLLRESQKAIPAAGR